MVINNANKVSRFIRIYETEIGLWYESRLRVYKDYRQVGRIDRGLINKAVTTVNPCGYDRFLVTVQLPNLHFLQRQY